MKLLDLISKKKKEDSLEHKINPVYDTAKDCLINLVSADCKEAILLNDELSFTSEKKSGSSIKKGTALFQETRYRFVNDQIEKSNIKNVLDIGCGYSPRGIYLSELGYKYVGADLPAVIRDLKPAVEKCTKNNINYVSVDATNPDSLLKAAEELNGEIIIITEGMFMYFPVYELNEYLKGLKALLEKHGGYIITPDFGMNKLLKVSIAYTNNKLISNLLQKIASMVVKNYTVPTKDKMDPSVWYSKEDDDEPYKYFVEKGFKVERIAMYNDDIKLNSLSYINNLKQKLLLKEYKNIFAWKISL